MKKFLKHQTLWMLINIFCVFGEFLEQTPPPLPLPRSSNYNQEDYCWPKKITVNNKTFSFGYAEVYSVALSSEICSKTDKPLASITCWKYNLATLPDLFFIPQEDVVNFLKSYRMDISKSQLFSLLSFENALTDYQLNELSGLSLKGLGYHEVLYSELKPQNISSFNLMRLLSLSVRISNTSLSRNIAIGAFRTYNSFYSPTDMSPKINFNNYKLPTKLMQLGLTEALPTDELKKILKAELISDADYLNLISIQNNLTSAEALSLSLGRFTDKDALQLISLWNNEVFDYDFQAILWGIILSQSDLMQFVEFPSNILTKEFSAFVSFAVIAQDFNISRFSKISKILASSKLGYVVSSSNLSNYDSSLLLSPAVNVSNVELKRLLGVEKSTIGHESISSLVAFAIFQNIMPSSLLPSTLYLLRNQRKTKHLNNLLRWIPEHFLKNISADSLKLKDVLKFVYSLSNHTNLFTGFKGIKDILKAERLPDIERSSPEPVAEYLIESLSEHSCILPDSCSSTLNFLPSDEVTLSYHSENVCYPQQIVGDQSDHQTLNFCYSKKNSIAPSTEKCPGSNRPLAVLRCVGIKQVQEYDANAFTSKGKSEDVAMYNISSFQFFPCDLTLATYQNMTSSNSDSEILSTLQILTSQPDELTFSDVSLATNILSEYQERVKEQSISVDDLKSITQVVNNLLSASEKTNNSSRFSQTISRLLSTLNNLAKIVALPANTSNANASSESVSVQIERANPSNNARINQTIYNDKSFNLTTNGKQGTTTSINIPSHSIERIARQSQTSDPVIYATVIEEGSLLDSNHRTSQIVSIQARNLSAIRVPFSIEFVGVEAPAAITITSNPFKRRLEKAELAEWNFKDLKWTHPYNCHKTESKVSQFSYKCDRFASYAILFSSKIVPSNFVLTIVSYIGCCCSIVFLLATVLIHLIYKKIRQLQITPTLVNICICLIFVYALFVEGVGRTSNEAVCDGMAFMLHYATLACVAWMTINAYQMYKALTNVSYVMDSNRFLVYFLGYGLPLVVVLINFSVTVLYLDKRHDTTDIFFESLYRSKFACWLQPPSIYWGFLLPIGIMLIYNYAVFGFLLGKVSCAKSKVRSSRKNIPLKDRFVNAVTMVTMMGLTWVFGYLLLIADDVVYQSVMQWIFTLLNIFQGLLIFYLYCVRRENIRKIWMLCSTAGSPLNSQIHSSRRDPLATSNRFSQHIGASSSSL